MIQVLLADNPTELPFAKEDSEEEIKLEIIFGSEISEHYNISHYIEFDSRLTPLFALFSPFELYCNV